jgi:Ca2+-binding EF-hand superfamily protein
MIGNWILAATLIAAAPLSAQTLEKNKPDIKKVASTAIFDATDTDGDKTVTLGEVKEQRTSMRDALRKAGEADDPLKARDEVKKDYRGKISLEKFLRYDTNDDGKLTTAEFSNAEEGAEPDLSDADRKLFAGVSFDEWAAYAKSNGDEFQLSDFRDAMAVHRAAIRANAKDNPSKMYTMNRSNSVLRDYHNLLIVDANRDGKIVRSESVDFWTKKFAGEELTLDAKNAELYAEALYLERLSSLDFNEDGSLTRDEIQNAYDAPSDAEWKKLDKDADDKLSKEEVRAWDLPDAWEPESKTPEIETDDENK